MKIIKTLQKVVTIGVLYSANIFAQGQGWNFTYLAPTSCNNDGLYVRYYSAEYERAYDLQGNNVPLLSQYGVVKADTLLLDSRYVPAHLPKSITISGDHYQVGIDITNSGYADRLTFAQLLYAGKIKMHEVDVGLLYEVTDNMYVSIMVSVFRGNFVNEGFVDLTPATENGGFNLNNANWKSFLDQYANILTGYGLQTASYVKNAVGDIKCLVTCDDIYAYEDMVTCEAHAGIIIPTGTRERLDHIFSIDYGYKKQWGMVVGGTATASFLNDYCKLQGGASIIFFKNGTKLVRMYTDEHQSNIDEHQGNFIKLAQGKARHDVGAVWNLYGMCQFSLPDKPVYGVIGYSYNAQARTLLYPEDDSAFRSYIVNNDPKLQKWSSHTLFTEISFVKELNNDRVTWIEQCDVSFLFDYPLAGKNTVKGKCYGVSSGIVVKFDF